MVLLIESIFYLFITSLGVCLSGIPVYPVTAVPTFSTMPKVSEKNNLNEERYIAKTWGDDTSPPSLFPRKANVPFILAS